VLTGVSLVIPPSSVLLLFEDVVKDLRKLITNLLSSQRVLQQTRDLLLPKLISGQLDVSDLDIEIPDDIA
jgi:type I restriction enzyme S subunit